MKEYSIDSFHKELEEQQITSEQLVSEYLDRINSIDKNGPSLNSIIEINPDAIEIAKEIDKYFKENNKKIGPLHGIPILIKDNIDTFDKMQTTAGSISILRHGGKVTKDAFIVTKMREAGAIILGKTNLSEMANFRGLRSVSGWSSRGGQTKNPYILNRNPSGSSSGSAVAVAANLCIVAIGTETDGSITSPSNNNGIVGLKPTLGSVSRSGIVPIAHSQDTAGPMGRTVKDVAIVQSIISGYDSNDSVTELVGEIDNTEIKLEKNNLKDKRLGVLKSNFNFHREVEKIGSKTVEKLEELGAILIDPIEIEIPHSLNTDEYNTLLYEYHHDLIKYFSDRSGTSIFGAKELVDYNETYENEVLSIFGQEQLERAINVNSLEEEYSNAKKSYQKLRDNIDDVFQKKKLDAVIYPSGTPAWLTDNINGDAHYVGSCYQFPAVSGYPHITVPMGYIEELPIGISIVGLPKTEGLLLSIAYAFEQNTMIRKAPKFIDSL